MELIDKVIIIIKNTHDGNDLTPQDLKLTELAVNGFLNDKGIQKIEELYHAVSNGIYQRPPYLGVEYMDRDHEGYVYFKGQEVEHYSSFWAYSLDAKASLKKLQQQCLFLESKGIPVQRTLHCSWKMGGEYAEEFCAMQKEKLDDSIKDRAILFSIVKREYDSFLTPGHPTYHDVLSSPRYQDICSFRKCYASPFSITSYVYGNGLMWNHASEEELDYIDCCFDYLKDKGYLQEISEEHHSIRQNAEERQEECIHEDIDEEDYER